MTKQDAITAPVAFTALVYDEIHSVGEFLSAEAQLWLPVLGGLWLIVQIFAKIYQTWLKNGR